MLTQSSVLLSGAVSGLGGRSGAGDFGVEIVRTVNHSRREGITVYRQHVVGDLALNVSRAAEGVQHTTQCVGGVGQCPCSASV